MNLGYKIIAGLAILLGTIHQAFAFGANKFTQNTLWFIGSGDLFGFDRFAPRTAFDEKCFAVDERNRKFSAAGRRDRAARRDYQSGESSRRS